MPEPAERLRIAAIADMHYTTTSESLQPLLSQVSGMADVLLLCGDLTDWGLPEEADALVKQLSVVKVPMIGVLGNHDYESGKADEVRQIMMAGGCRILDGEVHELHGVGFAGVKGFAGGFGRRTLEPWGEAMIKMFVQEALDEALKLESALARLRTEQRIAILHYAPLREMVEGEPEEIFAFLGSSRLEEPLNRYAVSAVFHGHAHRGSLEGKTQTGIPVYNVALPLLRRKFPDQPPVRIIEVPLQTPHG